MPALVGCSVDWCFGLYNFHIRRYRLIRDILHPELFILLRRQHAIDGYFLKGLDAGSVVRRGVSNGVVLHFLREEDVSFACALGVLEVVVGFVGGGDPFTKDVDDAVAITYIDGDGAGRETEGADG